MPICKKNDISAKNPYYKIFTNLILSESKNRRK